MIGGAETEKGMISRMVKTQHYSHSVDGEEISCLAAFPDADSGNGWVVIMHGAGTSNKERVRPVVMGFATAGLPCVAFDFSGHGRSTGILAELSLERRFNQAVGVVEKFADGSAPLTLVGFSMSGQTVADLTQHYKQRVRAVCLCSPAAYHPDAWSTPFGSGFTELIRRPESWRASNAFAVFGDYAGRAVLIVPERDEVIPRGVTEQFELALRQKSMFTKLVVMGAGHQLGLWLAQDEYGRARLVDLCLNPERAPETALWNSPVSP